MAVAWHGLSGSSRCSVDCHRQQVLFLLRAFCTLLSTDLAIDCASRGEGFLWSACRAVRVIPGQPDEQGAAAARPVGGAAAQRPVRHFSNGLCTNSPTHTVFPIWQLKVPAFPLASFVFVTFSCFWTHDNFCVPERWDWGALRADIAAHGVRNSLLVAPMPTASTSQARRLQGVPASWPTRRPSTDRQYNV